MENCKSCCRSCLAELQSGDKIVYVEVGAFDPHTKSIGEGEQKFQPYFEVPDFSGAYHIECFRAVDFT